jgi:hypothetical protein
LNVACFTLLTAFAQLATMTSRVAVLTYTMPIWARCSRASSWGAAHPGARHCAPACAAGLAVLIQPLIGSADVIGLVIALTTAVTWAAGTVYLKWAQIKADPMAIAVWQLLLALVITVAGLLVFEGSLHLWPVGPLALSGWSLPASPARPRLSALVRDRPAAAGDGRVAGRAERSGRGRRRLRAGAGRAASIHDVIGFVLILPPPPACCSRPPRSVPGRPDRKK